MSKLSARARKTRWTQFYRTRVEPRLQRPMFGDGCSFSPDGFVLKDGYVSIVPCCEDHDRAYHTGGGDTDRKEADKDLHFCIRCRVGHLRALVYYRAVRTFGWINFAFKDE